MRLAQATSRSLTTISWRAHYDGHLSEALLSYTAEGRTMFRTTSVGATPISSHSFPMTCISRPAHRDAMLYDRRHIRLRSPPFSAAAGVAVAFYPYCSGPHPSAVLCSLTLNEGGSPDDSSWARVNVATSVGFTAARMRRSPGFACSRSLLQV